MTKPVCWVDDPSTDHACYWQKAWRKMYNWWMDNAPIELKRKYWLTIEDGEEE